MITIIDKLVELQKLEAAPEPLTPATTTLKQTLRADLPKPILDHFDRLRAQGKTGVAGVRHGVCTGCHIQLCSGTSARLARHDDIQICDSCGRYLFEVPEPVEAVKPPEPPPVKRRATRKSAKAKLVPA